MDWSNFREINVTRAKTVFSVYDNGGPLFFATALAGELGELCNLVKKKERARLGGPDIGHSTRLAGITQERLKDEIGGIVVYLDLLASLYGIDIEDAVRTTFNRVSKDLGTPLLIPEED